METIHEKLKNMETAQLLTELSYGKDAFQENIYQLYMEEAISRGIVDENFSNKLEYVKEKNRTTDGNKLLTAGIFMLIFMFFLGIPSFIIGFMLHKKNDDGTYVYDAPTRKAAKILIIVPPSLWFGIPLLIFILDKVI